MADELEKLTVAELRKLAGSRGIGSSGWRVMAGKDALLGALRGGEVQPMAAGNGSGGNNLAQAIAQGIADLLPPASIDPEEFNELARQAIENSDTLKAQAELIAELQRKLDAGEFESKKAAASLTVAFSSPLKTGAVSGLCHRQLPQVVTWTAAGVSVWLWGGAGCGKTHMARQVASALGLPSYVLSIDPTMTVGKLVGYRNIASGEFVEGFLYAPFKLGGVVMLDEVDTGDAGILAALNSLLANDSYMFPNGETVQRHANFRVIAGANTKGVGAVAGYTARQRLDAATLNRFAVIELQLDEGLETALVCGGENPSKPWTCGGPLTAEKAATARKSWVSYVQKVRNTDSIGKSVLISPRASLLGAAAITAGVPFAEVAEALLFGLCDTDTRSRILNRCPLP